MRRIHSAYVLSVRLRIGSIDVTCRLQLVIDKHLEALPKRETDRATVVRAKDADVNKAHTYKLNTTIGNDAVFVERYVMM